MTTDETLGKRYRVRILPTAQQDLREAAKYIAKDNPAAAKKFVADIRARINNVLAVTPNICTPHPAYPFLADLGFKRFSVHVNWSALWKWKGQVIEIHRILHQRRNWSLIMGGPVDEEDTEE